MIFFCAYVTGVNDSYTLINMILSWYDAQAYCRANFIDLPSIRNSVENEKVRVAANGRKVYIGLYRNRTWSDGSDSSFRHWKSGQPDNANLAQHCTAMSFSDSGLWTDESCANNLPFFCYKGKNTLHVACCFCKLSQVIDTVNRLAELHLEDKRYVLY